MSGILRILNIMILARLLLQDNMGQIAILGIIYGYLQFLGALGLNHAAPLFIPKAEKSGHEGSVKAFLEQSIIITIISSSGFGLLAFLLLPLLIPTTILSPQLIHLVVLITPFSALEVFLDSFLLARYKVRNLAAGRLLFDLARVFLSVWLVLQGVGVTGVLYGWLIGEIIAVAIFSIFSRSGLRTQSSSIQS